MSTSPGDAGWCRIRIRGNLAPRWAAWFDNMTLTRAEDGTTLIEGPVADQAALHGVLTRVRDTGLPLVSVICEDDSYGSTTRVAGTTEAR